MGGHDGIREWWRDLFAVFPHYRVEVLEVRDVGDSAIVALRARAHGLEAMRPSTKRCGTDTRCVTASRLGGSPFEAKPKPSKPPDSGSRLTAALGRQAGIRPVRRVSVK